MVICESIYMQIPLQKNATKRNRPQESIFILAYNNCDEKLFQPLTRSTISITMMVTELENRQSKKPEIV